VMMNMYVMLMIMLCDVNACLTPRGVTPLDSRLWLPSEVYFILAGAQPELSYSAS
jgi:hypothetical protein